MALFALNDSIQFPPVQYAEPDGLLAVGGDLSRDRLIEAYKNGIFPWYDEPPILWWCPDPRCVIFPGQVKVSKSMRPYLNQSKFKFTYNTAFKEVITSCQQVPRKNQPGTWISTQIIRAYTALHEEGIGMSAECWYENELAGGLYGLKIGNIFFGESMFSKVPNASKFAFIKFARLLESWGVVLIDCQIHNSHLESLGAVMIPREEFLDYLKKGIKNV